MNKTNRSGRDAGHHHEPVAAGLRAGQIRLIKANRYYIPIAGFLQEFGQILFGLKGESIRNSGNGCSGGRGSRPVRIEGKEQRGIPPLIKRSCDISVRMS